MKIDVLGTEYTIVDDKRDDCDGYCDKTTKVIAVCINTSDCELGNVAAYRNKVLRHEIIHAFLFESGLHENWAHNASGHDETYVDWIAVQFPKLLKAFKDADAL